MRDHKFTLVLNAEETQRLQALARKENLSMSAALRQLLWKVEDLQPANQPEPARG